MNLAYVAGLFDGEGCVNFTRCRQSVYPRVLLVNTDRQVLEDLQAQFGGDIKPLHGQQQHWKQGWTWRLSWTKAVDFLARIQPWLRIKSDQAVTAFAWNAIRPGSGQRWSAEGLAAQDLCVRRMRWLNQKGVSMEPDPIDAVLAMREAGRTKKGKK